MKKVLLLNMPFVSVRYPSPALSLLQSILTDQGVSCDVRYLNIFFQAFTRRPQIYEGIADLILVGEWIFGEALFGKAWASSERGSFDALDAPLLPSGFKESAARDALTAFRSMAATFIDRCMEGISWDDYSIIGFTSVFSQHTASLALAKRIKERFPEKIIAMGGANCQEEMGTALLRLFPFVDWVFNGEADISFPQAVLQWFDGKPPKGIPGANYRSDDRIIEQGSGPSPELDDLPYPLFDDYFEALEHWAPDFQSFVPISLEFSRGCWWGNKSQCVFCGLNCRNLKFRRKSPQRAEAEIKTLAAKYHVDRVILTDSILDMSFFKTLLPSLAEWGGLAELFLEVRSNLNCQQVGILKSAGVSMFQPGIESLDTEMLSYMQKGTTLLQNIRFLKCAREYGIYPTWNLLYGFPGENPDAYRRMASLVSSIVHLSPPMDVSPVLVVRFSPLFEQSREWGMSNVQAHKGYRSIYPFEQEDVDVIASFFEFDHVGKEKVPRYIEPLKQQVRIWKQQWEQKPPSLTVVEEPGKIVLYDDRPSRKEDRIELTGDVAAAYAVCQDIASFKAIAEHVGSQKGEDHLGDDELRQALDSFVERRLMLREGDLYLGLATKPGQRMDISEEW
jgi:ribosomal peptide maturation radical SAM protein 1